MKIMDFFKSIHQELLFISLLFLFYFQVLNSFITNVYALNFSIMGIGPYTLLVVFFLSPPILLFFKRKLPLLGLYITISLLVISRILMLIITNTIAISIITGIGVSSFGVFLPAYLSSRKNNDCAPNNLTITQGLAIAIGTTICLKTINNSLDFSTYGFGAIVTGVFALVIILMIPGLEISMEEEVTEMILESETDFIQKETLVPKEKAKFGKVFLLAMGLYGIFFIEWIALAYPTAFTRWSDSSYVIITIITIAANLMFIILTLIYPKIFNKMKIWLLVILNILLISSILLVTLFAQPQYSLVQQIFTYVTAALSPIALIDFLLLTQELDKFKPRARKLGGSFGLASLLFLIVTFLTVSSFNYEWVPGMSILRDRFYLLIILAALLFILPVIFARGFKGFLENGFENLPKHICRKNQAIALTLIVMFSTVTGLGLGLNIINPQTPSNPLTLTIMTYNVHQGEDKLGQNNFVRILNSVKLANPDILALQESETARICFGNIDLVRFLAENLDMYYYYGPKTIEGVYGVATLSKFPIEFSETYFMPSEDHSQRVIIRTDLKIGSELITFYNTHFGLDLIEERVIQAEYVADLTSGSTRTFIVGDFNTKDNETAYPIYTAEFNDSWLIINPSGLNSTGWNGDTNRFPRRRIDYILFTPDFLINSVEVLTWASESDHWPVFGEFTL
ncbi:MAG TPA: endonuclease/exonuclease/phosphatase family protein [candidate division Zixibacteria bacterium]|nr:endonuclease/exonuclease/phosphatase family protein [candidate division Zixibacteria bacterium]